MIEKSRIFMPEHMVRWSDAILAGLAISRWSISKSLVCLPGDNHLEPSICGDSLTMLN
jgi:hypothetical protein